ncbi:VPLPA-CTERM-specific exosortase XrtD [Thiohalobacter thiocyanaticus]|uniref:VPLPA-CTERM-specific exosortase XrtD n=1 Tax=Thiohalobacter thiocyanaticus TaxID=585455 RepID=UPI001F4E5942|nr:VPLPA-CTERM-specific exosortase XrtD [Thiohalobacter thiocyanaticus]
MKSSYAGLVLVAAGGALLFLGLLATTHTLAQYSVVIVIMGLALTFLGWRAFKLVFAPLFLLFFMVPLPPFVFNNLSGKLQLISSEIGVAVIRLFDISVYLEGNVIDLGSYKLQVVEACSGLRYLFPLASLSFVAAYIYKGALWKKAIIFLSSAPITVLMNSFRIGVIGVLVEYGGPGQAEGFLHDFEGWVIFMACIAILVLEMAVLAKIGKNKMTLAEAFGIDIPVPPENPDRRYVKSGAPHYLFLVLAGVVTAGAVYAQNAENRVPERRLFVGFPMELAEWKGNEDKLETIYLDALKLDDYLIADYRNDAGQQINFYVAYYGDQTAGAAAHSPRSCIPGGGWQIKNHDVVSVEGVQAHGQPLEVNRMIIAKGDYRQLVYYWFQQRGRVINNEYWVKWYLFQDALTRHRTDGALVRLTIPIQPGQDLADAEEALQEFAGVVVPKLGPYVPE